LTAGFWSKDAILGGAFEQSLEGNWLGTAVFVMLAVSALLTAFYTARQISLTFLGKPRTQAAEHASEKRVDDDGAARGAGGPGRGRGLGRHSKRRSRCWASWSRIGSTALSARRSRRSSKLKVAEHFNPIPLVTSLVVALGGLFLGWWVYGRKALEAVSPIRWPAFGAGLQVDAGPLLFLMRCTTRS